MASLFSGDGRAPSTFLWAAIAVQAVVSAIDLAVPLGFATGVLGVLPLLVLLGSTVAWHIALVAVLATACALLDVRLGARGDVELSLVLVNRGLSVLAQWTTAGLLYVHLRDVRARLSIAEHRGRVVDAMLAASPDGILLVDRHNTVRLANAAAHRVFGYPPNALVGLPLSQLIPAAYHDQHERDAAAFRVNPASRSMALNRICHGKHKDGQLVPLEIALGHLDNDEPLVIATVRDVSEKQRMEERLRSTQRLEAIGKLAGGVAHDFNNMLAAIICNARLAIEGQPTGAPVIEDLNEILGAADRAADLTKQLLAFSRRQIIEPRNITINDVVTQTNKMLARLLGADIRQDLHLAPDLGTVRVDPAQLEQVLLNLVVNARDAMPGGGTLTIETTNVALDAAYAAEHPEVTPGDYVLLAVTDTGHGMAPEVRVRIFEPFFTTKPAGLGTGLGLATVYGAVKQAGGHIWVYSEQGKGTTFRVYLPRTKGEAEAVRLPREIVKPAGGAEVILIAEDEPALRRILVRTLRGAGYEVLEASNGEDALLKLQAWPDKCDLLLTDVVMPQMGGAELARRVRERYPHIAVLFASGYTENAIVHDGRLDADVVFLQKPFTPDEVLRRVRQVLDDSRRVQR